MISVFEEVNTHFFPYSVAQTNVNGEVIHAFEDRFATVESARAFLWDMLLLLGRGAILRNGRPIERLEVAV